MPKGARRDQAKDQAVIEIGKQILIWAAVLAGIASATLWFWSARVRVNWGAFGTINGPAPIVYVQLNKVARINQWAAITTGIATALQALAAVI